MTFMPNLASIVIYGGTNDSGVTTKFFPEVHLLNLRNLNWLEIQVNGFVPEPRAQHATSSYKTSLYIFGGVDHNGFCKADIMIIELN